MIRLTVNLSPEERNALFEYADMEMRSPRDQLRIILRQALIEKGLVIEVRTLSENQIADTGSLGRNSESAVDHAPSKLEDT